MKVKGIKVTFIFLILALVLMPFPIYAVEQTQIVPTWNWGSQYSSQFTVTNFCEGSGTSVSCELRFTANNSYYGYLSFDGYNGTTKWINYKNVWIADGYGAYRYSLYQNGVIQINKINIEGGFLKSSMDNLDLQDIIDLLNAIETDTTSIDNQINTELQRLQSIINNQIVQNGYLETLTKLRQWNIYTESIGFVYTALSLLPNNSVDIVSKQYGNYPTISLNPGDIFFDTSFNSSRRYYFIMELDQGYVWNTTSLNNVFTANNQNISMVYISDQLNNPYNLLMFYVENISGSAQRIRLAPTRTMKIIPIYSCNLHTSQSFFDVQNISTDFALQFGLKNQLLDDLHIIAQGTANSNSAASGLESSNSTMASDMNSMATIENGYSQDFNSQLQNIDFTNPIQQNQGILPAANFVISIFNGLINNNPFTVLIIIVCILLIGKKVIGK